MWDQVLINEGRLRYVQSESNKTVDSMNFDVTNGVRTLSDLRIDFIVIPTALLLASKPLLVNEGKLEAAGLSFSPSIFPPLESTLTSWRSPLRPSASSQIP